MSWNWPRKCPSQLRHPSFVTLIINDCLVSTFHSLALFEDFRSDLTVNESTEFWILEAKSKDHNRPFELKIWLGNRTINLFNHCQLIVLFGSYCFYKGSLSWFVTLLPRKSSYICHYSHICVKAWYELRLWSTSGELWPTGSVCFHKCVYSIPNMYIVILSNMINITLLI